MSTQPAVVGGLFEVCIGVPDLAEAIRHWEAFGYRAGATGQLDAAGAQELYGVPSAVQAVRLQHQEADHGLVRLMRWDRALGPGLNMAPLKTVGNRWTVAKTDDIINIANHAEIWELQGKPIRRIGPMINPRVRGADAPPNDPFRHTVTCLRELEICLPLYQHIIMQRFNVHIPLYGQVAEQSLLRTSQFCHAGLLIQSDDRRIADIYEHGFGLQRTAEAPVPYLRGGMGTVMFEIEEDEHLTLFDFDDARGGPGAAQRSGRLRLFLLHSRHPQKDRRADSRPGNLGYSLYTYRVSDLEAMRERLQAHGATALTATRRDEFGVAAFSFRTPDGYDWTFMQA